MKIALMGANGPTGRELIHRALDAGDTVTALVRAEDKLADIRHERLVVHVGSPCTPAVLESILPGHDVVVSVLGPRWPTKTASAIYPDSADAIVAAMERTNVRRLLVTSSAQLFPAHGWLARMLQRLVPHIVRGARRMEARIQSAAIDWTIARTGFLNDGRSTNYRIGLHGLPDDAGAVSRAALATFLLSEARQAEHARRIVGLCG